MKEYNEETIKWLEERELKLRELENMINKLQYEINDSDEKLNHDDTTMEIFKLWYFNTYEKHYDL